MPDLLHGLPDWAKTISAPAAVAALLMAVVLIWQAGNRAGQRRLAPAATRTQRAKDRALFAAAILAGATVYAGFVIGSYEGLTAFAHEKLGWTDWKENLVPVTLDGGAAAFAFLAFRAVARQQSPMRCYAIVWCSATASAGFNFMQGGPGHRWEAGVYLAFLSLAGMVMFHTFLDQFRTGADLVLTEYPKFGARWITYLPNTLCAALAWINHPAAGLEATVPNAIAHLENVRATKRAALYGVDVERSVAMPLWARAWPWAQARILRAAMTNTAEAHAAELAACGVLLVRAEQDAAAERIEMTGRLEKINAEHADALAAADAEREEMHQRFDRQIAEHAAAERQAHAEQIRILRDEHAFARAEWSTRLDAVDAARTEALRQEADVEQRCAVLTEQLSAATTNLAAERDRSAHLERLAQRSNSDRSEALERLSTAQQNHSEITALLSTVTAERDTERTRTQALERTLKELRAAHDECSEWAQEVDRMAAEHTERLEKVRSEHAERLSRARAEHHSKTTPTKGTERPTKKEKRSSPPTPARSQSDADKLQLLLAEHPEPEFEWSKNEVARVARVGFGGDRMERLLQLIAEHHSTTATNHQPGSTPKELEHAA